MDWSWHLVSSVLNGRNLALISVYIGITVIKYICTAWKLSIVFDTNPSFSEHFNITCMPANCHRYDICRIIRHILCPMSICLANALVCSCVMLKESKITQVVRETLNSLKYEHIDTILTSSYKWLQMKHFCHLVNRMQAPPIICGYSA